jgi:hypothetical protein
MGTSITLVLGNGVGEREFSVPFLLGMRFGDAKSMLEGNGIAIGSVIAHGVTDTLNAFIVRQNPERLDEERKVQKIRTGQMIDLWLQADKPVIDTTGQQIPLP